MKKIKILVLGNDPFINDIDFSRLDPNVITLGTNRIWLKHNPNHFFFHDVEIIKELGQNPKKLEQLIEDSNIFASDWLKIMSTRHRIKVPGWITVYNRLDRHKFVDCVSTSMEILDRHIYPDSKLQFYIAGVSLTWKDPSHFWKVDPPGNFMNKKGQAWYAPRFDRTYKNFDTLKGKGFDMINVTPDSRLNKLMRYESIGNLYTKQLF